MMVLKVVSAWRSCYVEIPGNVELLPKSEWKEGRRYKGSLAPMMDLMIEVSNRGLTDNCTMVEGYSFGTYDSVTGTYSGCLGLLERNQSEASAAVTEYPMKDLEVIDPFQVLFEDRLHFLTAYNSTQEEQLEYVDIVDSLVTTFDFSLWLLVFFVGMVGAVVLSLANHFLGKDEFQEKLRVKHMKMMGPDRHGLISDNDLFSESTSPLYESLVHLIGCESADYNGTTRRSISITLTLGSFLLIQYLTGFMSSDLVVAKTPVIIKNYDDLLRMMKGKQPLVPAFIDTWADFNEFKYARKDTIQAEMWQEMEKLKAKNYTIIVSAKQSVSEFILCTLDALQMKMGLIVSGMIMDLIKTTMCRLKATMSDFYPLSYPWRAVDPRSHPIQRGLVKRKDFHDHPASLNIEKYSRRLFEASVVTPLQKEIAKGFMPELQSNPEIVRDCNQDSLHMREIELVNFAIENFRSIYYLISIGFTSAFIVLALEVLVSKYSRRHSEKSRVLLATEVPSIVVT